MWRASITGHFMLVLSSKLLCGYTATGTAAFLILIIIIL